MEYDAFGWPASERPGQDGDAEPGANQTEDGQDVSGFTFDGRREARFGARPLNEIVERRPRVGRNAHEGFRTEIGESQPAGARQGVRGRHRHDQGFVRNGLGGDVPVRYRKDWKGNIDPAVEERLDLLPGVEGMKVERHVRMARKKGAEDLPQDARFGSRAEPEREAPDLSVSRLAGSFHRVVGVLEDVAHLLEKGPARFRERDEVSRPVEETHAKFALQVLNLMREGGCEMWSFSAARPK